MRSARATIATLAASAICAVGLVAIPPAADAGDGGHGHGHGKCERNNNSVRKLLECVTLRGVLQHERAFQRIADRNDGNRASGTSGYDKSLKYVEWRMKKAGYKVTRQEFEFNKFNDLGGSALEQTNPNDVAYVEGVDFGATPQSEPGDVTAPVTAVDIQLGIGNTSTSGCEPEDFAGFPDGNIALIQRGTCFFEVKAENAAAAGASGVLFFNQGESADPARNGIPAVTLGNDYTGGIPALSATYALGAALSAIANLEMRLFANVTRVPTTTENLIAESRKGDPNNVVMAGAHLDSVAEGPGINDNGSGSSALLEVAEQMAKTKTPNKTRFAWWGAEEDGTVGSAFYVASLTPEQLAGIEMYLNFDMVGSPNFGLFIYDGDGSGFGLEGPPGSDDIEALFERYYADRDIPTEPTAFDGRSDYFDFINNGVPAGGLFTGAEVPKTPEQAAKWGGTAGVAFDPCYHQACDTIDNLSYRALRINSDAMAYVIFLFASGKEVITTD
jgi:Zn-dependent M28 family amino/carboxypeptidase